MHCYIGFPILRMATNTTGILYFLEFFGFLDSIKNAFREGNLDQKAQNTTGGWF